MSINFPYNNIKPINNQNPYQLPSPINSFIPPRFAPLPKNQGNFQSQHAISNMSYASPQHSRNTLFDGKLPSIDQLTGLSPNEKSDKNDKIESKKLLSTSSPEAIRVASQITPTRLANLLIRKGPLPIRHITSQLAIEVPGFEHLSLSKQRRLIMSAMEQSDPTNNVVFEKIGWGQWAVRKIDSDYIVTEGTEDERPEIEGDKLSVHELRNQSGLKLGWSKKQSLKKGPRRESITNNKPNLHNLKLPNESLSNSSAAISSDSEDDYAVDDEDDGESDMEEDDFEDALFTFEDENAMKNKSPPIQFANRVPLKVSPPPSGPNARRRSSSSIINKSYGPNRHQLFSRSRLNSIENLDNYIVSSAKNSGISINSPPPSASHAVLNTAILSGSPSWSSNYIHQNPSLHGSVDSTDGIKSAGRRKSSFNESHIRSTLSSSLPKHHLMLSSPPTNSLMLSSPPTKPTYDASSHTTSASSVMRRPSNQHANQSDTDEEDWATIGAESLRKRDQDKKKEETDETRAAAFALVDLMSV